MSTPGVNICSISDDWTIYSMSFGPGFRYYPSNTAPDGFFLGVYFDYRKISATYKPDNSSVKTSAFSGALWFGREWIMQAISFEIATGIAYSTDYTVEVKDTSTGTTESYSYIVNCKNN